jgi:hypothetical protein
MLQEFQFFEDTFSPLNFKKHTLCPASTHDCPKSEFWVFVLRKEARSRSKFRTFVRREDSSGYFRKQMYEIWPRNYLN